LGEGLSSFTVFFFNGILIVLWEFVSGVCFFTATEEDFSTLFIGSFFWLGGIYLGGFIVSGVGNFWKRYVIKYVINCHQNGDIKLN
jgi:hypothetical protein